jgi:hypothetical protein
VNDPKTDGGAVYKQIIRDEKLKTGKIGQKIRTDWEKSIKVTCKPSQSLEVIL